MNNQFTVNLLNKKDLVYSCLIVIAVGLLSSPQSWILGVGSLMSMVFVVYMLLRFIHSGDLMYACGLPSIALTWIYFSAPCLYAKLPEYQGRIMPTEFLPEMAWYSNASVIALCLGYLLTCNNNTIKPISHKYYKLSSEDIGRLVVVLLLVALTQRLIWYYLPGMLDPLGQLLVLLDFTPVLTVALGILYFLRGGRSVYLISLVSVFFCFEVLLRISETLTSLLLYMIVALVLVYVLERKKIPVIAIIVLFIVFFPIYNSKTIFRNEAVQRWHYQAEEDKAKIPELIPLGFSYLMKSYEIFEFENLFKDVQKQGNSRFENITYLGQCVYLVEYHDKPLKYGESFWWLPFTVVPRIIFPWKPVNYQGTLMASEYGLRNPFGHSAFNFPMLVEYYINFSFLGMVVLSFIQGMIMKWCLSKAAFGQGDINLLLLVCLLWDLVRVESNITLVFGAMFHSIIIWWLLAKVLSFMSESYRHSESQPAQL